jgi:hypothetical protein
VLAWVDAFNRADVDALGAMYGADAINHQVAESPVEGREAIRAMFATGFDIAEMVCIPENLFEDGEWAILEWRDPKGLRGCGFFHVVNGTIIFQRAIGISCRFSSCTAYRREKIRTAATPPSSLATNLARAKTIGVRDPNDAARTSPGRNTESSRFRVPSVQIAKFREARAGHPGKTRRLWLCRSCRPYWPEFIRMIV